MLPRKGYPGGISEFLVLCCTAAGKELKGSLSSFNEPRSTEVSMLKESFSRDKTPTAGFSNEIFKLQELIFCYCFNGYYINFSHVFSVYKVMALEI